MTVAERITITIPDGLHQRLQVVKDKLNVSGLCRQAIEQAVAIEEIKMKDIPVKQKVVERLRLEKEVANREWKETGFTDGMKDAEELSYEDFRALEATSEVPKETRDWVIEEHFRYYDNPDEDLYFKGWIEGALHFWNEIKDEL